MLKLLLSHVARRYFQSGRVSRLKFLRKTDFAHERQAEARIGPVSKTFQYAKSGFRVLKICFIAGGVLLIAGNIYRAYTLKTKLLTIDSGSTLYWRPQKDGICEVQQGRGFPFGGGPGLFRANGLNEPVTLLDTIRAIRWAAVDPRISGLAVDFSARGFSNGGFGFAQLQEIGDAIDFFREQKAKTHGSNYDLVAYADEMSNQGMYYLASKFNMVVVEPANTLCLTGFNQTKLSFKRLLDKLGVGVHAETREEYKSITSMFTHELLPEAQKQNLHALLSDLTDQFAQGIASARGIPLEQMHKLLDRGIIGTDEAVKQKLISGLQHKRDVYQTIMKRPEKTLPVDEDSLTKSMVARIDATEKEFAEKIMPRLGPDAKAEFWLSMPRLDDFRKEKDTSISLKRYRTARRMELDAAMDAQERFDVPYVARLFSKRRSESTSGAAPSLHSEFTYRTVGLVHIDGQITRNSGSYDIGSVARALVEAGKDPAVDAVVLRVNSGGGDAVASETICEAVSYVRNELKKPVVASFGNMAASGGYYSAASANKIFAMPGTITGSIGVAALRPTLEQKLLDNIGVTHSELSTTKSGLALLSPFKRYEGEYLELYKSQIDKTYDLFLKRVATGRDMTVEQVRQVAGGRVFTGKQALEHQLVDALGGLDDALAEAGKLAMQYSEQRLPPEIQEKQNNIRKKFHLETPVPTVQIKHFPRKRTLFETAELILGEESVAYDEAFSVRSALKFAAVLAKLAVADAAVNLGVSILTDTVSTVSAKDVENVYKSRFQSKQFYSFETELCEADFLF